MLFVFTPLFYRNALTPYEYHLKRCENQFLFLKNQGKSCAVLLFLLWCFPGLLLHKKSITGESLSTAAQICLYNPLIKGFLRVTRDGPASAKGGTKFLWKIDQSFCSLDPKPSHGANFETSTSLLSRNSAAALLWWVWSTVQQKIDNIPFVIAIFSSSTGVTYYLLCCFFGVSFFFFVIMFYNWRSNIKFQGKSKVKRMLFLFPQ